MSLLLDVLSNIRRRKFNFWMPLCATIGYAPGGDGVYTLNVRARPIPAPGGPRSVATGGAQRNPCKEFCFPESAPAEQRKPSPGVSALLVMPLGVSELGMFEVREIWFSSGGVSIDLPTYSPILCYGPCERVPEEQKGRFRYVDIRVRYKDRNWVLPSFLKLSTRERFDDNTALLCALGDVIIPLADYPYIALVGRYIICRLDLVTGDCEAVFEFPGRTEETKRLRKTERIVPRNGGFVVVYEFGIAAISAQGTLDWIRRLEPMDEYVACTVEAVYFRRTAVVYDPAEWGIALKDGKIIELVPGIRARVRPE